ncbi:hypothetical protein ACWEHL_35225, partial [Streptomyces sp. NPDC004726]
MGAEIAVRLPLQYGDVVRLGGPGRVDGGAVRLDPYHGRGAEGVCLLLAVLPLVCVAVLYRTRYRVAGSRRLSPSR